MHRSWIGVGIVTGGGCGLVIGFILGLVHGRTSPTGDETAVLGAIVLGLLGIIFGAMCGAATDLANRLGRRPHADGPEADYRDPPPGP